MTIYIDYCRPTFVFILKDICSTWNILHTVQPLGNTSSDGAIMIG